MSNTHYVIVPNLFGRFVLVHATRPELAWSGSKWVPHNNCIGFPIQVSNFATEDEARKVAAEQGLQEDTRS